MCNTIQFPDLVPLPALLLSLYPVHLPNYRVLELGLVSPRAEILMCIFRYFVILSNNTISINNSINALYYYLILSSIKSFRRQMLFIISDVEQWDRLLFSRVQQYQRLIHYLLQALFLRYSKTWKLGIIYHLFMLHSVLFLLFEIKEWIVSWCYCKQERINITVFSELLLPETLLVLPSKLSFFALAAFSPGPSCKLSNQYIIQDHMAAHFKKLMSAEGVYSF